MQHNTIRLKRQVKFRRRIYSHPSVGVVDLDALQRMMSKNGKIMDPASWLEEVAWFRFYRYGDARQIDKLCGMGAVQ